MEEKKELLDQDERVVEIELERLRGFVNHPFKVQADSQMIELQESIKKYGILIDRVVFKTEQLHRFFPVSYTAEQMRREILEMLKLNMNKYWDTEIDRMTLNGNSVYIDNCQENTYPEVLHSDQRNF